MNDFPAGDEQVLRQVERAIEQGRPVDDPVIRQLAQMRPKADPSFQKGLVQMLLSELAAQTGDHWATNNPRRRNAWGKHRSRTMAAMAALIVVLGALVFGLMTQRPASTGQAAVTPIEPSSPVVLAAQAIPAGTTITGDMLAVVSLSELDRQRLREAAPARDFLSDPQAVIGQTAATAMGWFQPIEPGQLGEPCVANCLDVPAGYSQIGLPLPTDGARGLPIGARVDVVATAEGELRLMASDVQLTDVTPEFVMLAAPEWQIVGLIELATSNASVMLRMHTGPERPPRDETWTEFAFIAPEALPEDYDFDLMVNVPSNRGDILVGLPYALGPVRATTDGDVLRLWFTDLDVVSVVRGTAVTIRLSTSDAANLDALIDQGMELTFIPDV